jgi:hypothetical protein
MDVKAAQSPINSSHFAQIESMVLFYRAVSVNNMT